MTTITLSADNTLVLSGDWTIQTLNHIERAFSKIPLPSQTTLTLDAAEMQSLDSAGAWLIHCIMNACKAKNNSVELVNFSQQHQSMFTLASSHKDDISKDISKHKKQTIFYRIGKESMNKINESMKYFNFIGQLSFLFGKIFTKPRLWQLKATFKIIQENGIYALPIIGLLSFLIGIVLAYQLGLQLKLYGANVYIVSLSGMAILREFGPLITAIIVAGRTTSSYTAQLGLMKVNEEVDALSAMGISPINRLALPRLLGVVIAVPLLTMWADAFGVFGSILMSDYMLDIKPQDFISRFNEDVDLASLWAGISKAPVFGILVASVGCFQGFQVSYSAASIGRKTTISVVQAIFLVIIADAYFSVLYSWAGI